MKKRVVSLIVSFALVLGISISVFALATPASASSYPTDIAQSSYRDDIITICNYGGLNGLLGADGKFYPDQDCRAWEFATMLTNLFGARYITPSNYGSQVITQDVACYILTDVTRQLGRTVTFDKVTTGATVCRGLGCALIRMTLDCGGTDLTSKIVSVSGSSQTVCSFTDVPANSWYANAVAWAVDNGISNGTSATTFAPDDGVTLAQMYYFLWRGNKSPSANKVSCPYSGVASDNMYYQALCWAGQNGLIASDRINPFTTLASRSDMLWCLWTLAGSPRISGSLTFTDVPAGASYATAARWGVKNGVVSGGTTFSPLAPLTRAMAVTMLYNRYRDVNYTGYNGVQSDDTGWYYYNGEKFSTGVWYRYGVGWLYNGQWFENYGG